jgi:hypothetical protein
LLLRLLGVNILLAHEKEALTNGSRVPLLLRAGVPCGGPGRVPQGAWESAWQLEALQVRVRP